MHSINSEPSIRSQTTKKESQVQDNSVVFELGDVLKSLDQRSGQSSTPSFTINRTQSKNETMGKVMNNPNNQNGKRNLSHDFGILLPKRPNILNTTEQVISKEESYDKHVDALVESALERVYHSFHELIPRKSRNK